MQRRRSDRETPQTADASDSGCRSRETRCLIEILLHPRMQESDQTAERDRSCRSIRCRSLQEIDRDSCSSIRCLIERLLHPLQESLYQTVDESLSISSGCSALSQLQENLYQTAEEISSAASAAGDTLSAGDQTAERSLLSCRSIRCRILSMIERLLHQLSAGDQTAERDSCIRPLSLIGESGCRSLPIQRMQESLYQTADAGDSLSDAGVSAIRLLIERLLSLISGCLPTRQRMQESLYQTADSRVSLSAASAVSLSDRDALSCRSIRCLQENLYQTAERVLLSCIRCLIRETPAIRLSDRETPASAV